MAEIKIDDLIKYIVTKNSLTTDDKVNMLKSLITSCQIAPDYFLRKYQNEIVECWHRKKDENGTVKIIKIECENPEEILSKYKKPKQKRV